MQVRVWVSVVGVAVWPRRWLPKPLVLPQERRVLPDPTWAPPVGPICVPVLDPASAPGGPSRLPLHLLAQDKVSFQKPLCFVSSSAQCQWAGLKAPLSLFIWDVVTGPRR